MVNGQSLFASINLLYSPVLASEPETLLDLCDTRPLAKVRQRLIYEININHAVTEVSVDLFHDVTHGFLKSHTWSYIWAPLASTNPVNKEEDGVRCWGSTVIDNHQDTTYIHIFYFPLICFSADYFPNDVSLPYTFFCRVFFIIYSLRNPERWPGIVHKSRPAGSDCLRKQQHRLLNQESAQVCSSNKVTARRILSNNVPRTFFLFF